MKSSWALLCLGIIAFSLAFIQPIPALYNFVQNDSVSTPVQSILQTPAQEVGDNKSFWALNLDTMEPYVADAYLLAIGDLCYIYFEDLVISIIGEEETNARAETYRDEFDTNIYSRVTDLAGNPNGTLGDADGDPRVYILIAEHRQSYYRQSNEVPGEYSNLCEMVYICYRTSNPVRTIVHEFHHLVWFNYEWDEVHFVLEGPAEYATYYSGYLPANNRTTRVQDFLEDIDDSLIYFEIEAQDYGACYLFAFYLAEQYGVQFLQDLVQHADDGAVGLETALYAAGHNISFNDLYLDWMTALTIDEQGFADDRYYLQDMDATIQDYSTIESLPYQDDSLPLYCYGSKVYQLTSPPDSFSVEMSQPADGVAGFSVAYRDLHGWHVQQMQEEGRVIMNVIGESIDTAYVIASHLFSETPAGDIDFGSGPQETVQVFMYEGNETTDTTTDTPTPTTVNNDQALLIIAGAMPLAATIIVLVLILQRREKESVELMS
ncbi:MAG: hypothetical protein RTV41_13575 [Candidatus Thorarchaeota archaeon]